MRPVFTALAGLAVLAHFAFLVYLPTGGFLALRWRRGIWPHIAAVLWGAGSLALRWPCPLTDAERWARARAGMGPLEPAGFIDHYLTGVLYPASAAGAVAAAVFVSVAVSWIAYLAGVGGHRKPVS